MRNWQQQVMGTVVSFSVREARITTTETAAAVERAQAVLSRADDVFSTWKAESPVSRLRRGEIVLGDAPPEVADVLELCRRVREASDGWFDPWTMPGGVDPTGLVKGWAVERALDELKAAGVPAAMINAGGDIAVYGEPDPGEPWRIGIRDPLDAGRILLTAEIDGLGAVATSGSYERGAHLVDPGTGEPVTDLLAATVIGIDLAFADALATALYVSGGRMLKRLSLLTGYHGLVVDAHGTIRASRGFPIVIPGIEAVPA